MIFSYFDTFICYSCGPNCVGDVATPRCCCHGENRLFCFNSHLTRLSAVTDEYGHHYFVFSLAPRVCKMDKFLKRSQPSTSGTSVNSGGGESYPKKKRHYDDSYLKYGFTVINNKPQCVICGDVLSRESMKPSKLMRHLTTKHQKEADKPLDFFERKLKALSQQQNTIIQVSNNI